MLSYFMIQIHNTETTIQELTVIVRRAVLHEGANSYAICIIKIIVFKFVNANAEHTATYTVCCALLTPQLPAKLAHNCHDHHQLKHPRLCDQPVREQTLEVVKTAY